LNRALRLAFRTLNVGRVMVAAQSLGLALAAFREASRRAVERRAFGQPIIDNQGIGFKLADMAVEISAARKRRDEFPKEFVTLPGESYPSSALVDACYTILFAPKSAALQ
jgi:alkylation response protein AidB-like acyl-CoA dehydrogenase